MNSAHPRHSFRGPAGELPILDTDQLALDLAMLVEGETTGRDLEQVLTEFGRSRSAYFEKLHRYRTEGLAGMLPRPSGPARPWRRSLEVLRRVVAARLADPERSAASIATELTNDGLKVSARSVERTLQEFGLTQRDRSRG